MHEMPKAYEPQQFEDDTYARWEQSGAFIPENLSDFETREPYTIVVPPPNATGTLHIGHATMLAIEDSLIRYQRMNGKRALWVPGTDHAALATQNKVEKDIFKAEGVTRHDLGRDELLRRIDAFVESKRDRIKFQFRKMGASLDWSREAFTLDAPRSLAVRTVFKKMYDDGLIYRGNRVINWCSRCASTLSDDEVESKTRTATLYFFKYDRAFPITIASTQPETKLGDTAVAVHPSDERYAAFVNKNFTVAFGGVGGAALTLRVIADHAVEKEFGTGALGVTPAHSMVDYQMSLQHDLPLAHIIGEDGRMTEAAGHEYAGLTTNEAREKVVAWLRAERLIEKEEEIEQNVPICSRCDTEIIPLPKLQWFVAVNKKFKFQQSSRHAVVGIAAGAEVTLKETMRHVVATDQISIIPERFGKTYFHWIENLRDWCISRQIWYGHRIPVWYCASCPDPIVSTDEVVVCPTCSGAVAQDPDVLDTWFSSGTWTFSTLGWPNDNGDLATYHPTDVLETGYDILACWVSRMILLTTYALGEVPFRTVYLHGLVRDADGRKMSKSIGNVIDPLDVAPKYGTDAVRLALLLGQTPGNDSRMSEEKIAGFRNFTNKLWNISRYIFSQVVGSGTYQRLITESDLTNAELTTLDKWILSRFAAVARAFSEAIEKFEFSRAGEVLRDFTWNEFADWYLEGAKVEGGKHDVLHYVLQNLLKLWHPYMPFVTEVIWQSAYARGADDFLMVASWPDYGAMALYPEAEREFERAQRVITAVRAMRSDFGVPASAVVPVTVVSPKYAPVLAEQKLVIERLGRCTLLFADAAPDGQLASVIEEGVVAIPRIEAAGSPDAAIRLATERDEVAHYIEAVRAKLSNDEFVGRAPAAVVERERAKLDEAVERLGIIDARLGRGG
ncbi:MAG: valine--tRNA ligase [Candidatus Magasanikbacteria bacterium RIFCSPHIGHO2_02_FULL_50_9b]|uniref:Valine--tRNA ligase n=1 Tax=Candidatus Magasanikbacteria bacterium RIFCSPHIGHO2_02_FULL_50_9b TaxID=1798682 RepID=A0A1F6M8S6_9BACT|nr:MAG: valine--tRNA ligase [Candidatus Magasanikbacteria bacterium RIFCSPHIGHO2_02_FULL_50_9b]